MAGKSMSLIFEEFSKTKCFRLGSTRISRTISPADYNSVVAGLTMWYGVILDYNDLYCKRNQGSTNRGRIFSHALTGWTGNECELEEFLTYLDELGEACIKHASSSEGFKAPLLLKELATAIVPSWIQPINGCILKVLSSITCEDVEGEAQLLLVLRQISCFLKKLDVDRPDLVEEMEDEFLFFEGELSVQSHERRGDPFYQCLVSEMRQILESHLGAFSIIPLAPRHGPGAVSDVSVKSWVEKHTVARSDVRIGYLLRKADLGEQADYLPFVSGKSSTRTSRYICVPKTWKKLRGISAEPAELQFWQQGVSQRIDEMFRHDEWWRHRVDLHSQDHSRDLAMLGSKTGKFATVDLSAASDSVTLQLVRDLFGNTELGRWLIGTRSTHTQCGDNTVRIDKFAPMGSACCFPVECIVFALAAEVAVRRSCKPSQKLRETRIFGDDIIVPTYAAETLINILTSLGFSVNTEKSFWKGYFREACGVECWKGHDIAPCRFRAWGNGARSPYANHDEVSSLLALANEMYRRGLHDTRAFLLERLFEKKVRLGRGVSVSAQEAVFATFSGESSTLASPQPTNFQVRKKVSRDLQTEVYRRLMWQLRPSSRELPEQLAQAVDLCEYVDWLIRHQSELPTPEPEWLEVCEIAGTNPFARIPLGMTMKPTVKWTLPPSRDFIPY